MKPAECFGVSAQVGTSLPRYSLDDADGIAEFILRNVGLL